ncbi:TonB-dependent receptor domain-containing protein [Novosphingobium sp.]|uniref:TonB-dependent receptor domain-containing protein n=1 Tax=Novosphingobium sp. TaxID=1874826 RepID=UPI0035B0D651
MNFIRKSALNSATCLNGAALAIALLALGQAAPAMAQDKDPAPQPAACEDADKNGTCDSEETDVIVVTGSRIKLPNLTNPEPTVSLSAQYLEDRGITNVADALNEVPGYRGAVTPNGAQGSFGQGVNFINSFGMGSNRTLTLLNGRRVVTSNVSSVFNNASFGTQVDLNVIPTILIDRTDRVSIGGAPVYGSDAIAGTVNIVLKRKYEGLRLLATTGLTGEGDNFRYNIQGAGGFNFADGRANLTAAVGYEKVAGMLFSARDYYNLNLGNLTNPTSAQAASFGPAGRTPANDGRINPGIGFNDTTTDGFPGSVLVRGVTIPSLTRGGLITTGSQAYSLMFDPNGNLVPFNRGVLYGGAITSSAARASGGDGFTFNDYSQITSDIERINANLFFNFELTDKIRLFAEGMYFRGQGNELVQQPTFNSTLFAGVSGPLTFRTDNPFLSSQARSTLAANGYTTTFRLSRSNVDLADLTGYSKNELKRGVIGVDGDFDMGGRTFNFEVSTTYGRNDFTDFGQNIDQQKFVNAINVALVGGQITCTTTPTVTGTPTAPVADAGCVPLNLFGEGAPSAAALKYILADVTAKSRMEQWVVNANLGGSPFDLFGNPVGFNVGYEHRLEKSQFTPDAFQQAGLGRSVAIAPTGGQYNLDEVFGEVLVPIITPQNEFIFSKLNAFGRIRYVDNTVNGGFTSWAAGGAFAPIADVEFRGNFTRSFRAPAITELFAPRTNTFVTVPDLCSTANINAGPVPTVRSANCAAFLAKYPTATPLAASLATVPGLSGGNPNLANEKADSFTYGVILRPRFIPGLSVAVDYLSIKLTDPISSLTATNIAQGCFDNTDFNTADPANGNQFCSFIRRDPSGQVVVDALNPGVVTGFVNGKQIRFSGVQAVVDYETSLDKLGIKGTLDLGLDLFHVRNRLTDITGVAPSPNHGTVGDPAWQGQLRLRYSNKRWGFSTNINYVGQQLISRTNRGPSPNDTREFDHYDPYTTVDASVFFKVEGGYRLTLSATNVFNRIGQKYYGYYIPGAINDPFGRRFSLSVSKTF